MPVSGSTKGLPRPIEIAVGLAGLAASLPVLGAACVAIRMTSAGPALFRQRRVGLHGRPFTLYKLRTMRTAAPGAQVTARGDARVTAVGRVLRKSKLDELPELWNVVRGDLSLVGARPEVESYVDLGDPRWRQVLEERPGITHPVTLKLRNEEELLASAPGDSGEYYRKTLLPWKLKGYLDYAAMRSWHSDLGVLWRTVEVILLPERAEAPKHEELASVAAQQGPVNAAGPAGHY